MAIKFTTNVTGATSVTRRMQKRKANIQNMRGAHLAAIIALRKWVDENFQAEGSKHSDFNLKWKPLSPVTIRRRREGNKKSLGTKILQDTGRLKTSFKYSATSVQGTLENQVKYSVTHEEGTRKVPRRKIFPTIRQGEEIVKPAYEAFIAKNIIDPR